MSMSNLVPGSVQYILCSILFIFVGLVLTSLAVDVLGQFLFVE